MAGDCFQSPPKKLRQKGGIKDFLDSHIGKPIDILPGNKLPGNLSVIRRIRSYQQQVALGVYAMKRKDMVCSVASEVKSIWERASVDSIRIDKVQVKLSKMLDEMDKHLKHWERLKPDKDPFLSFKLGLEKLFDISPTDLYQRLKSSRAPYWEEDWLWYQGMCQIPQKGCMTTRDASLDLRRQRSNDREERHAAYQARAQTQSHQQPLEPSPSTSSNSSNTWTWEDRWNELPSPPVLSSSIKVAEHELRERHNQMSTDLSDDEDLSHIERRRDTDYQPTEWQQRKENSKQNTIALPSASRRSLLRDTTATATRYNISSAAHVAMVASTVKAAGGDVEEFTISHATVKRHRKTEQACQGSMINKSFVIKWKGWPKIIHWDGKMM